MADFPVSYEGVTLPVSISAGFTASNTDNHDFEKLLHQADIALYQAKQAGRNQCIGYID
ncbi:GGDEF domain-containing protein [Psychromonas sp. KJ10-2]|uniref:GGDEF domain-containing protein n=1 Tax=Psychromonas sp. KJ10-2 TaxID=3391822 RepID=UPI0039B567D9